MSKNMMEYILLSIFNPVPAKLKKGANEIQNVLFSRVAFNDQIGTQIETIPNVNLS